MIELFLITALGGRELPFPQELRLSPATLPDAIDYCATHIAELERYLVQNEVDCPLKLRGDEIVALDVSGTWTTVPASLPAAAPAPAKLSREAMPSISVVIPSFNQVRFVRQTLDSLFSQNYPRLEVIVLDPGSTDGTREILEEYRDRIDRLILEPDAGQSDALQKGLNLAQGEILTWLCTDDLLAPNALVCAAAAFMRYRCDMVVGACMRIDENGATLGKHYAAMPFNSVVDMNWMGMMDMVHQWEAGHFFYQPEVLFTKDIWRRSGGFFHQSAYYGMDYDLWVRMGLAGARGVQIKATVGCSRQQPEQKTKQDGDRQYFWQIAAFLKLYRQTLLAAATDSISLDSSAFDADTLALVGKKINVGCGARWRPGWINFDFISNSEHVTAHNLLTGIPCANDSCAVVYHSHIIEHFTRKDANAFLSECYRVLRPGGTLRIAFPDLEKIAHDYLEILSELKKGNKTVEADYEWVLLTMLDQMVRNVPGGQMATYFMKDRVINEQFIAQYTGKSLAADLIRSGKQAFLSGQQPADEVLKSLPQGIKTMKIGNFRTSGEVHQWMYDTYSLSKLLSHTGFTEITVRDAFTSRIPGWTAYNLDTEPDGSIYKPESAYIEAVKTHE